MRRAFLLGAVMMGGMFSSSIYAKDKVLMTIDGKDIMKSEFEYLYEKNSKQQIEDTSVEEYLDMFILYKMKVAEAEAAGIDTTAAFLKEFKGYESQLLKPYMEDSSVMDEMVKQYYENKKEDVDISYIVLPLTVGTQQTTSYQKMLADSLRNCIINGEKFEDIAFKYSVDRTGKSSNGHVGFVKSNGMPHEIEDAVYNTPIGELSEVIETEYGFFIIRPEGRRAALGQVYVRHILKLYPRGATEEQKAEVWAEVDSIYNVVKAGADFGDMAKNESQDPGTAAKGGLLPWFGEGKMVKEFQDVSFELEKGEISKPFATVYGVHIVEKLDEKSGVPSFEEMEAGIRSAIMGDNRARKPFLAQMEKFKAKYKLKYNEKTLELVIAKTEELGGINAEMREWMAGSNEVLFSYTGGDYKVKDLYNKIKEEKDMPVGAARGLFKRMAVKVQDDAIYGYARSQVPVENADYRNLINEYRDGMLLFEISNQKVWDGAAKDIEGIEAYFEANRDKYKWNEPKYKGLLIQVKNDSVAEAVKSELAVVSGDSVADYLKNKFNGFIRINMVIAAKGDNKMVDKAVFGVEDGEIIPNAKFPIFLVGNGAIIDAPEVAMDVRGSILADYQAVLESKWIAELKDKYSIKINKKVLKSIK